MNSRFKNGTLATLGYILSPLSWWNDVFINLPIAYALAFLFGLISPKLFSPVLLLGYWLTNVLGFVLLHLGIKGFLTKENAKDLCPAGNLKRELKKDILISVLYTIIMVLLIKAGWLKFPAKYFP